jgi:hypothetical protein
MSLKNHASSWNQSFHNDFIDRLAEILEQYGALDDMSEAEEEALALFMFNELYCPWRNVQLSRIEFRSVLSIFRPTSPP